jgi:carotenoid cleavage dioxygenase-like enzyme
VNGRPYRYFYGFGGYGSLFGDEKVTFDSANAVVKVDIVSGNTKSWRAQGCFPGEAIFVPRPGGTAEDDGVLMSLVLDSNTGQSFLLVLDAATMAELGRAALPHAVPFTLGGNFFTDEELEEPPDLGFSETRSAAEDYFGNLLRSDADDPVTTDWLKRLGMS